MARWARVLFVGALAAMTCGCTLRQFTSEVTTERASRDIVGSCLQLLADVPVRSARMTRDIEKPAVRTLNYDGTLSRRSAVQAGVGMDAPAVFTLRRGSRLKVERLLADHDPMVGVFLKPYVRLATNDGGGLYLADVLFEYESLYNGGPVLLDASIVERCR